MSKPRHDDEPGVRIVKDRVWIWVKAPEPAPYEISGKYLFFDPEREPLLAIATAEIREHGFHLAKVNIKKAPGTSEHVLCLYYKDDSRKHELASRGYPCKYRYWKSDADTRAGRYSESFLASLPPELREQFERRDGSVEQ